MSKKIFSLFFLYFLILMGGARFAIAEVEVPLPAYPDPSNYASYFFWIAIVLGGVAAVIVLVLSGIQFIYSAGSPEKRSDATKKIISAILGLVLLSSSFIIIRTINPKLKNLDPTEGLKLAGALRFVGGRDGAINGAKSGCGINECLALDGTCSFDNCGGYDYSGCEYSECLGENETPETDPDGESCSPDNCVSSISGCGSNQCLGIDGSCAWYNCNWGIEKLAFLSLENTDETLEKYSKIVWDLTFENLSGERVSGCDPENPNAIYNLYLYRNHNFKNLYKVERVKCNGARHDISMAKSYMLVKETPGVYFYGNENCFPSEDTPPGSYTSGIPNGLSGEIKSIRIVNGPNLGKGPFFGLIYFNGSDYRTRQTNPLFKHWPVNIYSQINAWDNYSKCYNIRSQNFRAIGGSWLVYNWVGWNEIGKSYAKAGDGVTLYTKTDWLGGYYESGKTESWIWDLNLQLTPVFYPQNSKIPIEEQRLCSNFNPEFSCLKSFEIKGNYLVLLSSKADPISSSQPWIYEIPKAATYGHAQAFPISSGLLETYKNRDSYSAEKGTPELPLDYIGWLKAARFMEIIPLSTKVK